MTLSQIMSEALMELDEDPGDLDEYEQRFMRYANDGYQIALREYIKPRRRDTVTTSEEGLAYISWMPILRIVGVFNERDDDIAFSLSADGDAVITNERNREIHVLYETAYPAMSDGEDTPIMPEHAHSALVDYVCYRHLSSGSLAKQSRAQYYLRSFYDAMSRLSQERRTDVRNFRNLYESTGI